MSKIVLHRDQESFGFFDLVLQDVKKHRRKLYLLTMAVAVIALTVLILLPNEYTASIRFMPENSSPTDRLTALASSMLPSELLASTVGVSAKSEGNTLKELFKSRRVYDAVLRHQYTDLDVTPDVDLYVYFGITQPQYARDRLASALTFSENLKSGIITLSATTTDPELSRQVVTTAVNELDNFKQSLNRATASQNRQFYIEELNRSRQKLNDLKSEQITFLSRNRNYINASDPALVQQIQEYEARLLMQGKITAGLEQMLTSLDMEINRTTPLLKIIEPADKPLIKTGPPRTKYLLMALVGSLLFGLGMILLINAYGWYFPQQTRTEIEDSLKLVQSDVTGVVNRLRPHILKKEKV